MPFKTDWAYQPETCATLTSMDISAISPEGHLSPFVSAVGVYAVTILLLGLSLTILRLWWRDHSRSRRARRAGRSGRKLNAGESVVSGTVELESGSNQTVRVEVEQKGSEWENSGEWLHSWSEVGRRVTVAPFYLNHACGQRIRVEPSKEKVFLVDDLKGAIWINMTRRIRFGELVPGERIVVKGQLSKGIDPEGWILRPPEGGPMMFSSSSLELHAEQRARIYGIAAIIIGLIFLATAVHVHHYHLSLWFGEPAEATVVDVQLRLTDDDGDSFPRSVLTLTSPEHGIDGLVQDVCPRFHEKLTIGSRVPIRIVPTHSGATHVGSQATTGTSELSFMVLFFLVATAIFLICWIFAPRHWQDHPPIPISGRGKLARTEADMDLSS